MSDHQQKIKNINELLIAIKRGEKEAVTSLYHEMAHTLRYIALKYLQNDADADDLVQEFWADIFHIAEKFSYVQNGFAYLCKIMKRRAINRCKAIFGRKEVRIGYVDYASLDTNDSGFSAEKDLQISIESAMRMLNEQEKIIIQETYFEDKTIRQISKDIGISKSNVGRIKLHALEKMKKYFDENGTNASDHC